jgi:hypothetical protein
MTAQVINISPPSETCEDVAIFDVSDDELERAAVVAAPTLISCTLDTSCPSRLSIFRQG